MQPRNELLEAGCLRAIVQTEDVAPAGVHHALVQVHGAARCTGDGFGHENGIESVFQSNFLGRVLEQKRLICHGHGVAMHQVDFVLRSAHFVNPGVGLHAQRDQGVAELVPKRRQRVEHVQAEGVLAYFGATTAHHGRLQRLGRVGIRGGQVKLDFRCDHRR